MAITYHAGRRIQGTQADFDGIPAISGGWKELGRTTLSNTPSGSPTYSDDFDTDDWVDQGSGVGVNTTTDRLEFSSWTDNTTNNSSTLDLGSALSDTKWVIRFKLQWTGFSNTSDWTAPAIGMFSASSATGGNSNQDMLYYWSIANGATKRVYLSSSDNDTMSGTDHNLNLSWVLDTTYYVQLQRDGASFSATVWTGSYEGTEVASGTDTIGGTVSGLQYFGVKSPVNNRGGSFTGWLDDLKIYDGILSTSLTNKPTNVQHNSLLIEKDTANRYWFTPTVEPANSANFDVSSNDHIDIPTTGLTSLANGSVSFWLNVATDTPNNGDNVVFSCSNSSTGSSEWVIGYYGSTNKISVLSRNNGSNVVSYQAGSLAKGTWYHIVYTNSSSTGNKLYINGSVVTPSYSQGSASTNAFMSSVSSINTCNIGANKDNGGYQWGMDGNIQQVLVYGSTLTSSEVTALYNSGNYNSSPSATNLLRRYELTSNVNDTSGNGHNGTATGVTFTSEAIPNSPTTTTATWTMPPTHEIDLSTSAGWTQVTNTNSEVTGGELIGLTNSSSTNGDGIWKDSGISFSDTAFVFRCKFQIVAGGGGSGNANTIYFGISDTNGATSPHSARDGFAIAITNYSNAGMLWNYPSGSTWDNEDTDLSLTPSATIYYLEIKRTSPTSVTFTFYDDSGFSSVVRTHTQTIPDTLNGLKYILVQTWRNGSNNTTKIAVSNMQVWNGVGSIH